MLTWQQELEVSEQLQLPRMERVPSLPQADSLQMREPLGEVPFPCSPPPSILRFERPPQAVFNFRFMLRRAKSHKRLYTAQRGGRFQPK